MSGRTRIEVIVDRRGSVEIQGAPGDSDAASIAKRLGLPELDPVMRAGELTPEVLERVAGRARILGYDVRMVGEDGEPVTGAPAEAGSVEAGRERRGLPGWVLVFTVLLALLIAAVVPVRDHLHRAYQPLPSLGAAVALAGAEIPEDAGLMGLLDPDDSRYLAVALGKEGRRLGDWTLAQGFAYRFTGVDPESLAALLGSRGSIFVLNLDASKSEPTRLHIDTIISDRTHRSWAGAALEVQPVRIVPAPEDCPEATGIVFDRLKTFENLGRFRASGSLEPGEDGPVLVGPEYRVVLDPALVPGLARVLESVFPGSAAAASNAVFYLSLEEIYPWGTRQEPGRRQTTGEIGRARILGIELEGIYLENAS